MKLRTLITGALVSLAVPSIALADDGADRLTRILEPLTTYVADFDQKILDGSGQRLQSASGEMWLARPGRFRWEVDAPYSQVVVSDGEQVTLYDPDLEQATIQPLDQRVTHTPALLLSGSAEALTENYDVMSSQRGTTEVFTLTPRSADTLFETLQLTFHGEQLGGLQMTDSTGQQTAIEFDNVKQNDSVQDNRFHVELPDNTDVIRSGN
ncbi:outer membrane lipoprotein chaperone LolA [Halomonas halocynthiae]|uniref:outer membrane lipoprotein chaperone LolA n=1 Tax=Halomonas halocynthiae TaxID=176290 RepID=UPI000422C14F|nr:outer membrane lipoprotein chaperone LolA [Halomonas halocynthiae]